jgi:hypothetical protein
MKHVAGTRWAGEANSAERLGLDCLWCKSIAKHWCETENSSLLKVSKEQLSIEVGATGRLLNFFWLLSGGQK